MLHVKGDSLLTVKLASCFGEHEETYLYEYVMCEGLPMWSLVTFHDLSKDFSLLT